MLVPFTDGVRRRLTCSFTSLAYALVACTDKGSGVACGSGVGVAISASSAAR